MAADPSNGWEATAHRFMTERSRIGATTVAAWSQSLPARASVLDLGCGHGVPITEVLIESGLEVFAIDASPTLVSAFQQRFPGVSVRCEAVEASSLFDRSFDAALAIGLLFLLPAATQRALLPRIARALRPGGRFLFTAPRQAVVWQDLSTGQRSESLGEAAYRAALAEAGFEIEVTYLDEGGNHYFDTLLRRPIGGVRVESVAARS